ncbi:MAG: polysaccharide biosynthesis protein, partial [Bacillota bacterium]|nr:polysaccharide biosynthesis protein [Bacillota bacterium]
PQYVGLAAGATVATGLLSLVDYLAAHPQTTAFYILFWMVLVLCLTFFRLSCRLLSVKLKSNHDKKLQKSSAPLPDLADPDDRDIRVMIIGAGYAASQIIRELAETESRYRPVVLIDDDPDKHSHHIRQVAIVGDRQQIRQAVTRYRIDEMILAVPDASRQLISELTAISRQTGCRLKILPRLSDLINGRICVRSIRCVTSEDLLGRAEESSHDPVSAAGLAGAVVLVTGGGGSVGSELCRQIAACGPKRLVIFDVYENNAYELQQELLARYGNNLDLEVRIGTVCDSERIDELICLFQPEVIFHAAACKQVPLMQTNPGEAVMTNLFGTYQTATAAARHQVRRFILLSTVSAGNPVSVVDATMRLAEMTVQSLSDRFPATIFTAVRFSNVLGSNGSVIPLFQQQIKLVRCITVTHPEIRRCFITLKEAAQLIMQAGFTAPGGAICIQNRQDTIRIADLAGNLVRLTGLEPGIDVEITYTGLRPGEKNSVECVLEHEPVPGEERNGLFTIIPGTKYRGDAAEIDRLETLIGWSSHALRRHLAFLRSSVKPSAGPLPQARETVVCAYDRQSAVYTIETTQKLSAQLAKPEVI